MSITIDASVAVAWCFEDETTPAVRRAMEWVADVGGFVPSHWRIEVANALVMGGRRKRIMPEERGISIDLLNELDIVEDRTTLDIWRRTIEVADQFGLTAYDAAYLELALRQQTPLATLDTGLRKAAKDAGVELLGL